MENALTSPGILEDWSQQLKCIVLSVLILVCILNKEHFNECLNTHHVDRNDHQYSVPFNEIPWHLSQPILQEFPFPDGGCLVP